MSGVNNLSNPRVVPRDFISSFYDNEDYQGDGIFYFKREIIIYSTRVAPREILSIPSLMIIDKEIIRDGIFYK
jgi:hypothetical protein